MYCNGVNVPNNKYVIFSIYRPPKQNINYFLNSLSQGFDFYSKHYENICILCDFNATAPNQHLALFLENQNLKSMIKNPTCFESSNKSVIDLSLILTNKKSKKSIKNSIKKVNLLNRD